jgi:hypothetical protein
VEKYKRPPWTFNKILYSEKEGLFPILKHVNWPERHDCALLTSKGYATRAVCDVLNLMGELSEPILIFCIHDADGPGTMIYQSMQEAVNARPRASNIRIENLGLEPEEARKMELEAEKVERTKDKRGEPKVIPVADYVPARWRTWLQSNRVELNAMTTPEFLEWLDGKVAPFHKGKLVPPDSVLEERLRESFGIQVRQNIIEDVLRNADVDTRVARECAALESELEKQLREIRQQVHNALQSEPTKHWSHPVDRVAAELACSGNGKPDSR